MAGLHTDRDNFLQKMDESIADGIKIDIRTKNVCKSFVQNITTLTLHLRSDADTKIVKSSIDELIQKIKKEIKLLDDALFCGIV